MYYVGGNANPYSLGSIGKCGSESSLADVLAIDNEARKYCTKQGMDNDAFQMGKCIDWYQANKRADSAFPGSAWNPVTWFGMGTNQNYYYNDVDTVISTYIQIVRSGSCPEYGHPSDSDRSNSEKAIKILSSNLPHYEENFIRVVLYNLEQGVKSHAIVPNMLYPLSIKDLKNPPAELAEVTNGFVAQIQANTKSDNEPTVLEQIGSGLQTAAVLGVVGLAVWGGVKVYTAYASVRSR